MANLFNDYIQPADLTGYTRAAVADWDANRFVLSRFLPEKLVPDLDYRFTRGSSALMDAATFRTYDAESPIGKRPGITRVTGELPPISRKVRLGEYDRLKLRGLDGSIRTAILDDAKILAGSIAARMEMARGEALYTGKILLNENGVVATVDFGRAAGHTVTAGTLWSDTANADPISDLIAWRDTYLTTNGVRPGSFMISSTTEGYLLKNVKIRALFANNVASPFRLSTEQISSVLQAFGLPSYFLYDAQVSVNGTPTRVVPANRLVFLPAGDEPLGETFYGITADSLELPGVAGTGEEPGIVASVWKDTDPVAVWTKASAIALPVLANPDLTFGATVA